MRLDTEELRNLACPISNMGRVLATRETEHNVVSFGEQLLLVGAEFRSLGEGEIDLLNYSPEHLTTLHANFAALAEVAEAGYSESARNNELLKAVGRAVDQLDLREECFELDSTLRKILSEFP